MTQDLMRGKVWAVRYIQAGKNVLESGEKGSSVTVMIERSEDGLGDGRKRQSVRAGSLPPSVFAQIIRIPRACSLFAFHRRTLRGDLLATYTLA
jgi:hypothetical protein